MAEPRKNFVGIQIGLVSFLDEGVNQVLDILQEKARVNALLPSTMSWSRGNAGRGLDWFPDHGKAEPDHLQGGAMVNIHPQYYGATTIKEFRAPDPLYQGVDYLEMVLPEAKRRGIKVYPYYCETAGREIRHVWVPNFIHVVEVDAWGRKAVRPCVNNADYRNWHVAILEDCFKSYDLDGYVWGVERRGPLLNILDGDVPTCFCPTCRQQAHERGIDAERARQGYQEIHDFAMRVRGGAAPLDGYLVEFLRLLFRHPEVVAWEKFWVDSHVALAQEIYGAVKWLNPKKEVGVHIWQLINTFNPLLRAQYPIESFGNCADFFKPVVYHDVAGFRFSRIVAGCTRTILGDFTPQEADRFLQRILHLNEAEWDDLPAAGFTADYIRRETARTVDATGGRVAVYPGINVGVQGTPKSSKQITPESVGAAVRASYEGGATGITISRNYSEAMLNCVAAVGQALDELGIKDTVPEGLRTEPVRGAASASGKAGADDRVAW
ncbi:MAG: hypothetical protein HY660_10425 [Armatimonadetes bacterium]|nr:hypothetical protein [Armatimonadota bacterium]